MSSSQIHTVKSNDLKTCNSVLVEEKITVLDSLRCMHRTNALQHMQLWNSVGF